jgi:cell division protein FtsL
MTGLLKKEILVAVIAAILTTIFFDPVIKWIWGLMIWLGGQTYSGILNEIYVNAALGHRNWIDTTIFIFILMAFLFIPFFLFTDFANSKIVSNIETRLGQLSPKSRKIIKLLFVITNAIVVLLIIISAFTDLQLNTSFEQRLAVLSPAISDQDYKELRADWAKMESRDDFLAINSRMENLAAQHNVKLPELLLP